MNPVANCAHNEVELVKHKTPIPGSNLLGTTDVWECKLCNARFFPAYGATGTEEKVCDDITARQRKGFAKYGRSVEGNPLSLREWLQHAYEEALDLSIYLKRATEELDDLAQWKESALKVIDEWELTWKAAGSPGIIGESKAEALRQWIWRQKEGDISHAQ